MQTTNEKANQDARRYAAGLMTRDEFQAKHAGVLIHRVPVGAVMEHTDSGLRTVARL